MDFSIYGELSEIKYENLYIHRWISLFVINKVGNSFYIEREKFFDLVRCTSNFIPEYLQRIENIDLSKSKITGSELGTNSNLSNAKLSGSTLVGEFNGTKFIGTHLCGCTIESYSHFNGVDFSGADLSELKSKYDEMESEFAVRFTECNFREAKFNNAVLDNFHFCGSQFNQADFSEASIKSNFLSCELEHVKASDRTSTSGIMLYGNDWNDAHTQPSSDKKKLIEIIFKEIDENLQKIILRDNPKFPCF